MYNTRKGKPKFDYLIAGSSREITEKDTDTNFDEKLDRELRRIELKRERGDRLKKRPANSGQTNNDQEDAGSSTTKEPFVNTKIDRENIAMILNPSNITGTEREQRKELVTRLCAVSARIYRPNAQVYYCKFCNKVYLNKPFLREHMMTFHRDKKEHLCDTCGKCFATATQLKRHIKECHVIPGSEFPCSVCSKIFTLRADLNTHVQIHRVSSEASRNIKYSCHLCSQSFGSSYLLGKHKATHPGPFGCKNCTKTFQSKRYLREHSIKVHKTSVMKQITSRMRSVKQAD